MPDGVEPWPGVDIAPYASEMHQLRRAEDLLRELANDTYMEYGHVAATPPLVILHMDESLWKRLQEWREAK